MTLPRVTPRLFKPWTPSQQPLGRVWSALLSTLLAASSQAALMSVGPLPYRSAADSPFLNNPRLVTSLEDFEDGALNLPNLVAVALPYTPPFPNDGRGIVLGPGAATHSVDGDDGVIDGSGAAGHAFRSNSFSAALTLPTTFSSALAFDLSPTASGQYPTAVGFVWTDGEPESYVWLVVVERGAASARIVGFSESLGQEAAQPATADDRFLGVISDIGIERVVIQSFFFARSDADSTSVPKQHVQLDHLQYALPRVPEPSTAPLVTLGTAALLMLVPRATPRIRQLQKSFRQPLRLMLAAVFGSLLAPTAQAAVMRLGPLPYRSAADSPFLNNPQLVTSLEDFEDGALNLPNLVAVPLPYTPPFPNEGRGIVLGPGAATHSVDGDDGVIDGSGAMGHSLQSTVFTVAITFPARFTAGLVFDLQPLPGGQYPTAFGFVWTHGEPGSHVLMSVSERTAPLNSTAIGFVQTFGDAAVGDGADDDRFIGVTSDVGINRVVIESIYYARSETDDGSGRLRFFELDHLQYAYPRVPEPGGAGLLAYAGLAGAAWRRGGTQPRRAHDAPPPALSPIHQRASRAMCGTLRNRSAATAADCAAGCRF